MKYGDLGKMSWNMFCFVGTKENYLCESPHIFFRWIYALIRLEILLLLCVRTNIVVI